MENKEFLAEKKKLIDQFVGLGVLPDHIAGLWSLAGYRAEGQNELLRGHPEIWEGDFTFEHLERPMGDLERAVWRAREELIKTFASHLPVFDRTGAFYKIDGRVWNERVTGYIDSGGGTVPLSRQSDTGIFCLVTQDKMWGFEIPFSTRVAASREWVARRGALEFPQIEEALRMWNLRHADISAINLDKSFAQNVLVNGEYIPIIEAALREWHEEKGLAFPRARLPRAWEAIGDMAAADIIRNHGVNIGIA